MRKQYQLDGSASLKPNIVVYTAVINACNKPADSSEKEECFQIAQLCMEEILHGDVGKPNFLTFATFLGVCSSTLLPSMRRDYIVMKTFEHCCAAGQVGKIVMEKLKLAASPALYKDLLAETSDRDGFLQLPCAWTVNVRGERNDNLKTENRKIFSKGTRNSSEFRPQSPASSGLALKTNDVG